MNDIALIVNALGWTLIHFIWQGLLVASLMWVLFKLIPQQRSQLRYVVGLGMYFLLLPVAINTFLFFYKSVSSVAAVITVELPMVNVAAGVRPGFEYWLNEGIEPLLPLVVLLWLLGVGLLAVRTLLAWAGTRLLVRNSVVPISAALQERVNGLVRRLGVRQVVSVLVSTRIHVPTVIGWIKPVILLPASVLVRLPQQQLEMIIAHELGHIHRYDYVVNLLQVVLDTLFFYHPQVRWMSRSIRQEREHCCDDFVLQQGCRPSVYARALANLEILRQPAHATTLAATGGDLLHRVHRIANKQSPRRSAGFVQFAMIATLVVAAGIGVRSGPEIGGPSDNGPSAFGSLDQSFGFSDGPSKAVLTTRIDPYERIRQGEESQSRRQQEQMAARLENSAVEDVRRDFIEPAIQDRAWDRSEVPSTPVLQLASVIQQTPSATSELLPELKPANFDLQSNEAEAPIDELALRTVRRATVKPVKTVNPRYPSYARSRAVEGWVKLSFTVDESGRPRDISVTSASPQRIFDRAAEKAMGKWKFEVLDGHDTSLPIAQTFEFSMHPSDVRPAARQRRCNTTGSNICGIAYRQESVETYGAKNIRLAATE